MFDLLIDATMYSCSGIGTYLQNLLPELSKHTEIKIAVLCRSKEEKLFKKFGWHPIVWNCGIYSPFRILNLSNIMPSAKVLWFPHFNVPIRLPTHHKLLVTIHDLFHLDCAHKLPLLHRLYSRFLVHQAIRSASDIITVSMASQSRILHYYSKITSKIHVFLNGGPQVDSEWIAQKKPYVLIVGNVKPHKNIHRAINAFKRFKQLYPDYQLKVVGKMDGFINGEQFNKDLDWHGLGIEFLGFVSDPELKILYQECALFMLPSLYEGFGLPLLEAAAHGARLCCSEIPSLMEIGKGHATFFDPNSTESMVDAMITSMQTVPDYDQTKLWLSKFSWEISAKQHFTLIQNNS